MFNINRSVDQIDFSARKSGVFSDDLSAVQSFDLAFSSWQHSLWKKPEKSNALTTENRENEHLTKDEGLNDENNNNNTHNNNDSKIVPISCRIVKIELNLKEEKSSKTPIIFF